MLGKLLKHEYKATARTMLPVLALFILLSVAMRFITDTIVDVDLGIVGVVLEVVIVIAYILIFAAVCFLGYFSSVLRFSKNIFSDEGYLMNTLPVKPWMHIVSKIIPAFTWLITCILACMFSVCIADDGFKGIGEFLNAIKSLFEDFFDVLAQQPLFVFQVVLAFVLGIVLSYLTFYCSLAIGNSFSKNKKLMSVVVFVILTTIGTIIATAVSEGLLNSMSEAFEVTTDTVYESDSAGVTVSVSSPAERGFKEANIVMLIENIMTFAFCVVTFFGSTYFMKNRLNLE